jgi:hypothetical protein
LATGVMMQCLYCVGLLIDKAFMLVLHGLITYS